MNTKFSFTAMLFAATLLVSGCSNSTDNSTDNSTVENNTTSENNETQEHNGTNENNETQEHNGTNENNETLSKILSSISFDGVNVPLDGALQTTLQTSASITVDGESNELPYSTLLTTDEENNGEIFGALKDKNDQLITFDDGSAYICNGTNQGIGSGIDHTSILQKNGKLYMVSQFECQIGAMYKAELEQDTQGKLAVKADSLEFISQKNEFGGFVHCAGMTTPWQSHLGSEEYDVDAKAVENNANVEGFTGNSYYDEVALYWEGDATKMTPYYYNWIPEVTIATDGSAEYTKHYSMGRFSHELAYVMPDHKTVYMSDDGTNVGLLMYIADTAEDLSAGTLYAAKFHQLASTNGGSFELEWIELGHASDSEVRAIIDPDSNTDTNDAPKFSDIFTTAEISDDGTCPAGFKAVNTSFDAECLQLKSGQEKVAAYLETRRYAAYVGATTELRKEEGITYDTTHNRLYVAMSEVSKGMKDNDSKYDKGSANDIRLIEKSCGAVYALDLDTNTTLNSNYAAKNFYAILVGKNKSYTGDYVGNSCDVDNISNPDNITYINNTDTLIIGEDSSGHKNNMVWAYSIEEDKLTRIATLPLSAEATSPFWHKNINNHSYFTLVTQHPDDGNKQTYVGMFGPIDGLSNDILLDTYSQGECENANYVWNENLNKCFVPTTMPIYPEPEELPSEPCFTTEDGVVLNTTFNCSSLSPWTQYSEASDGNWEISSYAGDIFAYISGYGNDEPSIDWLISPKLTLSGDENVSFRSIRGYTGSDIEVRVSTDYDGVSAPTTATWTTLDGVTLPEDKSGYSSWIESGSLDLSSFAGENVHIAFYHAAPGTTSGTVSNWEIDDIVIIGSGTATIPYTAELSFEGTSVFSTIDAPFSANITGGTQPYTYEWNFGDGVTSTEKAPTHNYTASGAYTVTVTITDAEGKTTTGTLEVTVEEPLDEQVPAQTSDLRIATFNSYLNRTTYGELAQDLEAGNDQQIKNVAEIIQRVRPEILLLNEFDYNGTTNIDLLINNYLKVAQNGQTAIDYPYYYVAPVNTGVATGKDVNNNGVIGTSGQDYGDDSFGFGEFPGQYGMVVLSQYPINTADVRTFQKFLWKDMPSNLMPTNEDGSSYYTQDVIDIYRLSSKSHWDIPVDVDGKVVHVLVSHPTPPTFDDGDKDDSSTFVVDWNGLRNHDEIRFWKDYVNGETYIYDDNNVSGGLVSGERFVIMGDQNADPDEGDSYDNAIMQLLSDTLIDSSFIPTSEGATSEGVSNRESDDTANWSMRADYVLPSTSGFTHINSGVFWPQLKDVKHYLVEESGDLENSSDHRMVWVDLDTDDTVVEPVESEAVTQSVTDFKSSLEPWQAISLASDKDWVSDATYGAKASGYNGDEDSNDWLISPKLSFTGDQILTFDSATNYSGPTMKVLVSTDFDGSDVQSATWSELNATLSAGSWAWTNSGNIDLSDLNDTTGFIAFQYTSDDSGAATWEVTNLYFGKELVNSMDIDFKSTFTPWQTLSLASDKDWVVDATYGAKASGYNGDEDSNDWLISPALKIDGNETLSFETATNYSGPKLKVLISKNFDGANVASADWTELNATLSDGSWAWVSSGDLNLSEYVGVANIAFQYTSDTTGAATWEVTNLVFGESNTTATAENNETNNTGVSSSDVLILSEIADPKNYYKTRFIEIYNPSDVAVDLSAYQIQKYANGGTTPAVIALSGTIAAEDYYVIAYDQASFDGNFSMSADMYANINGNGDDVYAIAKTDGTVVDVYGEIGVDGTGTDWEYLDAKAVRKTTATTPKTTWDANDWIVETTDQNAPDDFTPGSGETENNETNTTTYTVIYEKDFKTSLDPWQTISLASDKDWASDASYGAKASGYNGDEDSNDWLISPDMNLTGSEFVSFETATNYTGPELKVFISTNYDGSNVESATWTELSATLSSGSWAWVESGDIDLSSYTGKVNFAFQYTSDATGAATWEVTNFVVKKN